MVTPPKKKKTGKGFLLLSLMTIGVKTTQIDAPSQFVIVAKGTILLGMISGTYNHTIGPRVAP